MSLCHSDVNKMLCTGVNIPGTTNSSSVQYVFGNKLMHNKFNGRHHGVYCSMKEKC